jgi:serine/threonine-protein kinase
MLGRTLGSYRIHSLLGEGGMGKVYLAEHVKLGRRVALKLLREEYASKRDAVARFFTEAQAVNTIRHENIVDITDFVELPSGETFIIMELLEGQDLGELQRQDGKPIPLHRAMGIALQVCDALEAAHQVGVVHRDLKPDNVFVVNSATRRDFVKLLDFGVAKLLRDPTPADRWQTVAGSVIGTPAYMSPEQASGIPVDNRSDIYSLGAILYELFTGHPVFRAKSFGEYVVKHMNDEPIPPRDLKDAPRLPVALEQLILRCLEKDPDRRYQAVAELRDDLARATATIQAHVALGGTMDRRSYRRLFMWGLIVVGVTALAAAAFWLASGLSVEDVAREPSPGGSSATSGATPESEPVSPSKVVTARLTLVTDPKGAEVFRKGETASLGRTPLDLRLPNVGEDVEFLFRLEGYEEAVERVTVADNALFSVPLIPKKRPGAAVSPAPADKPAAQKQRRPKGRGGSVSKGVIRSADHPSEPRTKIKKRPAPINPEEVVDPFAQ